MKKKNPVISFLKDNIKLILLGTILLVIFNRYIIQIILSIVFAIMGIQTLKITRMVPHISIETVSAASFFFGYVWGWKYGLIFGVVIGIYGYLKISLIKLTTIVNALIMGFCGVLGALFSNMGWQFRTAFFVSFVIRGMICYPTFMALNPDPVENAIHSIGDPLFNIFITMQLMYVIYDLIKGFV